MAECTNCQSLRDQLTREMRRRLGLMAAIEAVIRMLDDQLDPEGKAERIRPWPRLVRGTVQRLQMLLEASRGDGA